MANPNPRQGNGILSVELGRSRDKKLEETGNGILMVNFIYVYIGQFFLIDFFF